MTVLEMNELDEEAIPKWALALINYRNESHLMTDSLTDNDISEVQLANLLKVIENGESAMFGRAKDIRLFMKASDEYENFFRTFFKLSYTQCYVIADTLDEFDSDELASFVFALNIAQTKECVFLYQDFRNFNDFRKAFKIWDNPHKDRWGYNFDPLDSFSKDFEDVAVRQYRSNQRNSTGKLTLLFLLREMYGEDQVLEVINRCNEDESEITMVDVLRLLQDWKNWRNYPVSWALSAVDDNLNRKLDLSEVGKNCDFH